LIFESSSSLPNIIIDLKVLFWFKVKRFWNSIPRFRKLQSFSLKWIQNHEL
jgi:hypothetical protein